MKKEMFYDVLSHVIVGVMGAGIAIFVMLQFIK